MRITSGGDGRSHLEAVLTLGGKNTPHTQQQHPPPQYVSSFHGGAAESKQRYTIKYKVDPRDTDTVNGTRQEILSADQKRKCIGGEDSKRISDTTSYIILHHTIILDR